MKNIYKLSALTLFITMGLTGCAALGKVEKGIKIAKGVGTGVKIINELGLLDGEKTPPKEEFTRLIDQPELRSLENLDPKLVKDYKNKDIKVNIVVEGKQKGKYFQHLKKTELDTVNQKGRENNEYNLVSLNSDGFRQDIPTLNFIEKGDMRARDKIYQHEKGMTNSYAYSEILVVKGWKQIYKGKELYDKADVLLAYAGKPTNANELDKIIASSKDGKATYLGRGFYVGVTRHKNDGSEGDLRTIHSYRAVPKAKFDVDFNQRTIVGVLKNKQDPNDFSVLEMIRSKGGHDFSVDLVNGKIKQEKGELVFSGDAILDGITPSNGEPKYENSTFEGKFMGPNATELAGSIDIDNSRYIDLDSNKIKKVKMVFNAKKDIH